MDVFSFLLTPRGAVSADQLSYKCKKALARRLQKRLLERLYPDIRADEDGAKEILQAEWGKEKL